MFIGHFGLGMAAKKAAPNVSLGTLFIAFQFLDLVWPTLLLLGVEQVVIHPELGGTRTFEFTHYPITHSLAMVIVWSLLFGSIYWLVKRDTRSALVVGFGVLSHWLLDLIVHFHDLPLYPGNSPFAGFGLWASVAGTLLVECAIFVTGIILYLRSTESTRTGRIVFWIIIILLALVQLSNFFAPAPENVKALAWSGQFQWLFVALAYWADGRSSKLKA
ncbi:MAG TPA: hypothetical protein VIN08_09415 [Ohtaekwangia sp.]|uniref:hypothetical protein n=1 Tax=Ohtaekwangia sp. TaxID=2066019 RepID=UPI002F946FE9